MPVSESSREYGGSPKDYSLERVRYVRARDGATGRCAPGDLEIGISDPVIVETGYFKVTKRANRRYNHSGV